jgi:hypothetical protein
MGSLRKDSFYLADFPVRCEEEVSERAQERNPAE